MNCLLCDSDSTAPFFKKWDPHWGLREYFLCSNCHFIFLSPEFHLSLPEEKRQYDCHENNPKQDGYVQFLKKLIDHLEPKFKTGSVGLDFGCGPGPAIDIILRKKSFDVNNYDPIYFPDKNLLNQKYDFITCTEVVEHFYKPRQEFKLLHSLLKKGRSFLGIMTEIWSSETDFSNWWYHREPTHVCFYQPGTFEWIGSWLGLSVEFPGTNVVIFSQGPRQDLLRSQD